MGTELAAGDATGRSRGQRGRRPAVALSLGLLVVAGAVVATVLASQSHAPQVTAGSPASAVGAVTVQRRDLVETDTESGTLSYADPQTVYDRLSGTITWLPAVGQAVTRGQVLFDVDDEPVILLYGSTPAYRQLSSSDSTGPDIGQLNRNLIALGYSDYGVIADDSWQTATTDAVEALQDMLGEKETGKLALGRVVFLPGKQLVNTVDGTVGSPTALDRPNASTEFVDLTTTATTTRSAKRHRRKHRRRKHPHQKSRGQKTAGAHGSGQTVSGASTIEGSSKSSDSSSKSGSGAASSSSAASAPTGTAILQTSSTHLIATVDLPASSQSEAVVGSSVSVEMPDGTTVGGTITAVSPIAQTSSNSGGNGNSGDGGGSGGSGGGSGGSGGGGSSSSATVPVTIALDQRVKGAGLDQAAVSVNFAQARARNVLSVPVTSLLATPGGGYAVQEAVTPHRLIPVTTGLFAAGFVQVSGPGVLPGLEVTDSQG
jgi:hypothetical protein